MNKTQFQAAIEIKKKKAIIFITHEASQIYLWFNTYPANPDKAFC